MFKRMAVALPFLSFCLLVTACSQGPASVVEDFYYGIESGEIEESLDVFSQATLDQVPRAKLKSGLQQATLELNEKEGIDDLEILEEEIIGEIAKIRVKVVYGDGSETTETLNLVREDGDWKIQPQK